MTKKIGAEVRKKDSELANALEQLDPTDVGKLGKLAAKAGFIVASQDDLDAIRQPVRDVLHYVAKARHDKGGHAV